LPLIASIQRNIGIDLQNNDPLVLFIILSLGGKIMSDDAKYLQVISNTVQNNEQ